MRIAILSDIHANLEAFNEVIIHLESVSPDKVICLGDLVGYGPDPDEVVHLFKKKGYFSLKGNHEAAFSQKRVRNWLNFQAKENSFKTESLLSSENLAYCTNLETACSLEQATFVHGLPPHSVLGYMSMASDKVLKRILGKMSERISFVGHTHELMLAQWDGHQLQRHSIQQGNYELSSQSKYMINAGSVGQPRDGENSAKYLLWDSTVNTIEVFYIPYDIKTTIAKIKERGFPEAYGLRLR